MTENYKEQLQSKLSELFQFNVADLDFGIYRIMNHKREEIKKFIKKDLIAAVDTEFEKYSTANKEEVEKELREIRKKIEETIGKDAFEASGEIKEEYKKLQVAKEYYKKKEELDNAKISEQHKAEIFSHIYQFFSRYYQDGDFLSLKRYSKQNKYAVPYNGEEVVLHWANKDQYYIKTGEYFKNYTFRVGDYKINLRLSNAEIDKNNNKSDRRFFVLKEGIGNIFFDENKKELTVFFEYRGINKEEEEKYGSKNIQENIINSIKVTIIDGIPNSGIKSALERNSEKSEGKTLLEDHLSTYIKKNTTDYFIHKDLKRFLEGELDFYIKNEVLMLDDLGSEKEVSIEKYITRIKVIKEISKKIIEFLAQIEDFQKKLWEKKKFVVKTDYCMTLDNVPEALYPEILKNKDQLNDWKILYGAGEEKQPTITSFGSKSIDEAYLKEHPYLALDTKFFDRQFKDELLASFDDLDEAVGGLMIKSENWQALNLIQEKYKEKVKCIYIDPPYNTGTDEFIYKDNYQHSSWLTMIENRTVASLPFWRKDGHLFVSIDKRESARLRILLDGILKDKFVADIANINNPQGRSDEQHIATAHENLLLYVNENATSYGWPAGENVTRRYRNAEGQKSYREVDLRKTGEGDRKEDRPNLFYYFYYCEETGKLFPSRDENCPSGYIQIKPIRVDGTEGRWRWELETAIARIDRLIAKPMERRDIWTIYEKDFLESDPKIKPTSVWNKKTFISHEASKYFRDMGFDKADFPHPKPLDLLVHITMMTTEDHSLVLDYFAGSGTTAHAILDFNKKDDSNRKYILIEMGDYFDTIMKPRIKKVMYSDNWSDGKPQSKDGISHVFKYQYLEQYEDTLNNIEFTTSGTVQKTLAELQGYFLRYMLDFETRGSSTRLNVDKLKKPFEYKLKITNENEPEDEVVDLVETFNYLLGLHVKQIRAFNINNNENYYRVIFGDKNNEAITIIWRNTDGLDLKADKEFIESTILRNFKAQKVYINGDSHLENALPIEPEFKKLMGG